MRVVPISLATSLGAWFVVLMSAAPGSSAETVRDRLWIWGHPAGAYNTSYLFAWPRKSSIEPVPAAQWMGIPNMIFVHYDGKPAPPFDAYYEPFKSLKRVYWSLVGAGGATSTQDREHVFRLAEAHHNIAGFILDDFFHESAVPRGDASGSQWLAENNVQFPVTLTFTAPTPVSCDSLELVQSDWPTGDYRSRDFEIECSRDGREFVRVQTGVLPNEPSARVRLTVPTEPLMALRMRILSTHDTNAAMSCGLGAVYLYRSGQRLNVGSWMAAASSCYPSFEPAGLLGIVRPLRASLTPEELRGLGQRKVRGRKLPILAVVYTGQISPRAKWHLDEVDEVCLWTWRPDDLKDLEANLTALETLVPGKPIYQGCYTYDFHSSRPLNVPLMKEQTEKGCAWLQAGRIQGLIFLATPNMDVGLEAVDWTRQWIQDFGDKPLTAATQMESRR